jgi:glycosyltransferase involved in cell wall biosynthesis
MRALFFGRHDSGYSRNLLAERLFARLGWEVCHYRPPASRMGWLTAFSAGLPKPDLVWVGAFRQPDIPSAAFWAARRGAPLVADPLISAYQKETGERRKWPETARPALRSLTREQGLLSLADVVAADTRAHADYFHTVLKVPEEKLRVLHVGAPENLFFPMPMPPPGPPWEVLFFGSFIGLQGPEVIADAARLLADAPVRVTFLGDGPLLEAAQERARGLSSVAFEPVVPFSLLPERVAKAHVLLGVFGATPKADLVIPNKVYQALALGRPVITRTARGYEGTLAGDPAIGWVPPADPAALAGKIRDFTAEGAALAKRGARGRELFQRFFNENILAGELEGILNLALRR